MTFEEALKRLQENDKTLTELDWNELNDTTDENQLSLPNLRRLVEALKENIHLKKLDLSNSGMGDTGAKLLAGVDNSTLQEVYIDKCNIGPEGAKAFENNRTITTLSIEDNPIGPEGAESLARNITLKLLGASQTNIGNRGCRALLKSKNIEILYLNENGLTDDALEDADGIQFETLYLQDNNITARGAEKLAKSHVQNLFLLGNKIGDEGAKKFYGNTSLVFLGIKHNDVTSKVGDELKRKLEEEKPLKVADTHTAKKARKNGINGEESQQQSKRQVLF